MPASRLLRQLAAPVLVVGALASPAAASKPPQSGWVASWATAQHVSGPALDNQTVRVITHLTQGGDEVRVRIGNALGTAPLLLGTVTVAIRSTGAAVVPGSLRALTFGGSRSVSVPAGGYVVSDPVGLATRPQQDLAVSAHVPTPATPSAHQEGFETSYLTAAGAGDHTADVAGTSYTSTTTQFLMVSAVDVHNPDVRGAVVVVGGSVTDGTGSNKTGPLGTGPAAPANSRWSDVLARRVLSSDEQFSVVEAGVGGNTASRACVPAGGTDPNASVEGRFDRDVLSLTGVRTVIVYAGTNDLGIGTGCTAAEIVGAFQALVRRAHAADVRVLISTVTPRVSYTPVQNAERHVVNAWITRWNRCGGGCDGTVDFDAVIRWPSYPNAVDPKYDAGDTIHPNADGYALMGQAIDLALLS